MEGIPTKCPTCSTQIPEGAVRCPGCGRVFGEDNRCPHCHAIAKARAVPGGYVCLACGKPRDRLPSTTVQGEPDGRMSIVAVAGAPRRSGLGIFGGASIFAGMLLAGASMALLGASGIGLIVAIAAVIAGVGGGAALIGAGRARSASMDAAAMRALKQRVLALAAKRNGDLTVTEVATALNVPEESADAALTQLSDGTRITAEVDESVGALHFVFHDLIKPPPKTRVEIAEESEEQEERSEQKRERE